MSWEMVLNAPNNTMYGPRILFIFYFLGRVPTCTLSSKSQRLPVFSSPYIASKTISNVFALEN